MSRSAHNWGAIQATIERANLSHETALLTSITLLKVVSERTLNIVEVVQHVKNNKSELGLAIEAAAITEAFCCSYRHSTRQSSWPSNGQRSLLHAFSGTLEEIEQYMNDQMDKSRAVRFFNTASNSANIKRFLDRLENIINRLDNLENVTESVTIALRGSLNDIRPLMFASPSLDARNESQVNGVATDDQPEGRTVSNSCIIPSPCSTETSGSFANIATRSTYTQSNEQPFAGHFQQHNLGPTSSVPTLGLPRDHSSSSSPLPTVISLYSVGDSNVPQSAEPPLNHIVPLNEHHSPMPLLSDQRESLHSLPPPSVFPFPHPINWVLGPSQAFNTPQFVVLMAHDHFSRLPPVTINNTISNIGNSNDTTTIG